MNVNNDYVSKYLNDAFLFVRTLVFKLSDLAALQNEEIIRRYGSAAVDLNDPYSWKYYLNISGMYHPTDKEMRVVSMDTLQEIVFTSENLKVHTATAEAYSYGTRDYYSLVSKFPDQVRLINGILNPADIEHAVTAKDGEVLSYRKDLIEVNEISLLEDLETSIQKMLFRWYNTQFNISSPIYAATLLSQLYMQLVPKFLNLRQRRCHTEEVHSFHVRMFLDSHSEVSKYLPYLTLEQALWLYRNIRYIERNAGRNEQFKTLIDKLLTNRQVPIGGYSVRQIDEFDEYIPRVVARLSPLNPKVNALRDDVQEIGEIYKRELEMAPGNQRYLYQKQDESVQLLRHAPSSAIQTKVLHSSMSDLSNAVPETFESVAIRQWCHMSNTGLYDAYVTFKDPKTSIVYSLKAEDAFVYFYYIGLMMDGFNVSRIPLYVNIRQRRTPKPTVEDLLSIVDTQQFNLKPVAEDLVSKQPVIRPCLSVSAFHTLATQLYEESYRHWFVIAATEDYYERALVENMTHRLFEDELTVLKFESLNMDAWLFEKNLPKYDHSREEATSLLINIYRAATGVTDNAYARLSNIQKALLSLFEELSSYSIQVTREINETDLILINWPAVRAGNVRQSQTDTRDIEVEVLIDTTGSDGGCTTDMLQDNESATHVKVSQNEVTRTIEIDAVPECTLNTSQVTSINDVASPMTLGVEYDGQYAPLDEAYGIIGYTLLNRLTESQFASLKSIYQ